MFDFQKFKKDSNQVERHDYTDAYPYLVSYFRNKSVITAEDFVCGAHMVYAWMPTILTLHSLDENLNEQLGDLVSIINRAKEESVLEESDISSLAGVVNNSVVGASKLLHFIAPESFPIWDSRVYRYLHHNKAAYGYRLNNAQAYLEYIKLVKSIISHDEFDLVHKHVNEKMGYNVTAMRAAELIMFQNASKIR